MTHARLVLGVLGAAAVATAGCGSSSSDGAKTTAPPQKAKAPAVAEPTRPAPTKRAYVRKADRLCRQAGDIGQRANVEVRKAFAAHKLVAAADAIEHFGPSFEAKVKQLQALPRPKSGDQRVLDGILKVMKAQVGALKVEATALRANNQQMLKQATDAQKQALQFGEELGKAYGFRVCGRTG